MYSGAYLTSVGFGENYIERMGRIRIDVELSFKFAGHAKWRGYARPKGLRRNAENAVWRGGKSAFSDFTHPADSPVEKNT